MQEETQLKPRFSASKKARRLFGYLVDSLVSVDPATPKADKVIESVRNDGFAADVPQNKKHCFDATISILCDLRLHGWTIKKGRDEQITLARPESHIDPKLERERVKRMHAVGRNAQLLRQSVRSFVRSMERKRLGPNGFTSVFSLMRDGREFAEKLEQFYTSSIDSRDLTSVIDPYFQLVEEGKRCEHTGLLINDVWRYFRHTWTNEYQTVPGRNLMLLVRDASAPYHPVIGIAALCSPVVHLSTRDDWIGWAPRQFVAYLQANPSTQWAKWILEQLEQLISEIYTADLVTDRVVSRANLTRPDESVISTLEEESSDVRGRHRLRPTKSEHKSPTDDLADHEWRRRTLTHLFRSKRCKRLAELLRARLRLNNAGFKKANSQSLAKALSTSEGRLAIDTIRKHVKAIHVGNDILDISVCGAIPPYSEILGGKLVAMMLTSPQVVQMYSRRYGKADSIIASSMAGKRISRRARLVALTTTSLYESGLNQYSRIAVPAKEVGGQSGSSVRFKRLGKTRGQGTYQFSAVTVDMIEAFMSHDANSRSVNSIFGEGVSPRLRKIRYGLDRCGFDSDFVLTHGSPRNVYGIALTEGLHAVLMGKQKRPQYLIPQKPASDVTKMIVDYWARRWMVKRLRKARILQRVSTHTLVSPIEHGARVVLPRIFEEEPLFHDIDD